MPHLSVRRQSPGSCFIVHWGLILPLNVCWVIKIQTLAEVLLSRDMPSQQRPLSLPIASSCSSPPGKSTFAGKIVQSLTDVPFPMVQLLGWVAARGFMRETAIGNWLLYSKSVSGTDT